MVAKTGSLLVTSELVCAYLASYLQAVVRSTILLSPREPDPGLEDPRGAAELRLGEPESAEGEGGHLAVSRLGERETSHRLADRCCLLRTHAAAPSCRSSAAGEIWFLRAGPPV